jgi:SAM-dependent methyltransferase
MKNISLLISPEVKSAYFSEFVDVAKKELTYCIDNIQPIHSKVGGLNFLEFQAKEESLKDLTKLSFFQGVFENKGNSLIPMDLTPDFLLHDNFIFGSKFKGKTNERFTQLMINIGLASIENKKDTKILDPMCGRATTLLWSLRYGYNAKGIEIDPKAPQDIKQIVKKWSKVNSISITTNEGSISKKSKSNVGKFLEVKSKSNNFKVVTGSSTECEKLLSSETFDLIISDIPYGIQHLSSKKSINPLDTLDSSLASWKNVLKESGRIIIGFNSNNPKRNDFIELSKKYELVVEDFSAPHRMSESIVRDIIILKK